MDTFEWTKIGGALCGALLIFLLLNWGTEIIYHSHDDYYGEEKLAYYLEVEVSDDEKEGPENIVPRSPRFLFTPSFNKVF